MRIRDGAWLLSSLVLAGCGLVLDLDPPATMSIDAAGRDAGPRDGGVRDGGTRDAGPPDAGAHDAGTHDAGDDAGEVRDATVRDAALDAGTGCGSSLDCEAGEYCARPRGVCHGPGTCAPMPGACPDIADPVCGCDWAIHGNVCDAASRGVNAMQDDACPSISPGGHWCGLVPSGSDPGGCLFCFDDADCPGALAPICVASSCASGVAGVCAFVPPLGRCYDQRQCRETERCEGAVSDACPPLQGTCEAP